MQRSSEAKSNQEPLASPAAGRRRWIRFSRNLVLLGAVFFVYTDTVPKKPRIDAVSYAEWTAELAARRGSVVVIPVWASWCQTCIEMLPSMAELSERYGQKGVLFASLCLDDHARKEDIEAAGRIVAANDARFPHFLPRQDIAASLEALTLKELPAVLVYDRTGELRYKLEGDRWSNAISPADVEDAIESLL